jgi:pyruvate,water dikinase
LQVDVSLARQRTRANAAALTGGEQSGVSMAINGQVYAAQIPNPLSAVERHAAKMGYERAATAFTEHGETYLREAIFPELDETNTRLQSLCTAAVDVDTVPPSVLADHLLECLRWSERAWTLHWLRPPDDPRERFTKLYAEITGDGRRDEAGELYSHEPNLMTDAVEGVAGLARIAQRNGPLRELLLACPAAEVLPALEGVEGGGELKAALGELLQRQGLRCGEGAGNERDVMAPSWREDPALVIELVRHYVTQDLDALAAAQAATRARRDARAAEVRASIAGETERAEFDFWLAAARRSLQAFEDHNYKIDSAAAALLRLALLAAARRLTAAGLLVDAEDVWLLHAEEIALALKGLEAENAAGQMHWRALIAARTALFEWQRQLEAPEWIGAPAPPGWTPTRPGFALNGETAPGAPPPDDVLVTGQSGSRGVATGQVRVVERNEVVPHVEHGDVVVARNASPLWAPIFPVAAAVVLDGGGFMQHALLTCREYGVPAIFQAKDATARLRDGQRVTVDATNGWVLPAEA